MYGLRPPTHLVSLLAGLVSLAPTGITCVARLPVIDPEVRAAVVRGPAIVLVDLRVAGGARPEGELRDAEAIARQRSAIAAAQQAIIGRLAGTRFAIRRRYTVIPMLAIEIGADALAVLERAGDLVTRIRPDAARTP